MDAFIQEMSRADEEWRKRNGAWTPEWERYYFWYSENTENGRTERKDKRVHSIVLMTVHEVSHMEVANHLGLEVLSLSVIPGEVMHRGGGYDFWRRTTVTLFAGYEGVKLFLQEYCGWPEVSADELSTMSSETDFEKIAAIGRHHEEISLSEAQYQARGLVRGLLPRIIESSLYVLTSEGRKLDRQGVRGCLELPAC